MLDVAHGEAPSLNKAGRRKPSAEQRALMKQRETIRHELLATTALASLNAIEMDPCFRGGFTGDDSRQQSKSPFGSRGTPRGNGLRVWEDERPEAVARRAALHAQFEELCHIREAELLEKFGEWPLAEGRLRREVRKRLDDCSPLS